MLRLVHPAPYAVSSSELISLGFGDQCVKLATYLSDAVVKNMLDLKPPAPCVFMAWWPGMEAYLPWSQ
jgi:hypothetical protein